VNQDEARALLTRLLVDVAPDVDLAGVDDDEPIQTALDLDSMDFLNLMSALHAATGIDVPEREYPALSTVRGFVDHVVARSGG
jgi:acyl carrier protein